MNKGRRQELTQLRFKRRLRDHRITPKPDGNYYAFKSSGAPCSCWVCRDEKYSRKVKHKAEPIT